MHPHDQLVERVQQIFTIGVRSWRVCARADAGLRWFAYMPVLPVRHIPEIDCVGRVEAGLRERLRMEVPFTNVDRAIRSERPWCRL